MWGVIGTDEFKAWYQSLTDEQAGAIDARVELLEGAGPDLGRPVVDSVKGSKFHNMKELRCTKEGALRVLFIFDPLRQAVLLLGGDKSTGSQWNEWYRKAIPQADALYQRYLDSLSRLGPTGQKQKVSVSPAKGQKQKESPTRGKKGFSHAPDHHSDSHLEGYSR